ncbi:hypothetical protein TcG_12450, partial [Trypanosoma cruzi]
TGRGIAASLVRCRTPSRYFLRSLCPTAMSCSTPRTSASRFSQYCATSLAQKIDVQRRSGLPLPKLRRSPHRTAQLRKVGLRLHALRQSRVIRVEFFSAPPKAPPRTA